MEIFPGTHAPLAGITHPRLCSVCIGLQSMLFSTSKLAVRVTPRSTTYPRNSDTLLANKTERGDSTLVRCLLTHLEISHVYCNGPYNKPVVFSPIQAGHIFRRVKNSGGINRCAFYYAFCIYSQVAYYFHVTSVQMMQDTI